MGLDLIMPSATLSITRMLSYSVGEFTQICSRIVEHVFAMHKYVYIHTFCRQMYSHYLFVDNFIIITSDMERYITFSIIFFFHKQNEE